MKPTISATKTGSSRNPLAHLKDINNLVVYVGIPATTATERATQIARKIAKTKSKTKKGKLADAATAAIMDDLNNAELLYLFSKGSLPQHIPARPVIEPAIVAKGNKEAIAYELSEASRATLSGDSNEARRRLKRAGVAGSNAAKKWFTDPRNGWAPNAPKTIALKGSDKPGIDTGAMRQAITSVTKEEAP